MLRLSIVVPAYNESQRIGTTLQRILTYLKGKDYDAEVIVVDDGSTDDTLNVAQSVNDRRVQVISNGANRGKGYSVRNGVMHAKGDWVLFSDADLSTPIEEVEKLFAADADVVIASRAVRRSTVIVRQPFYREWSGRLFNLMVQLLAVPGVKDTQCGFKLFRQQAARRIFDKMTIERFGFDVEVLYIARRYGYTIKEIPVAWYNDPRSKVSFVRDALRMFTDLLRIRWNDLKGRYAS